MDEIRRPAPGGAARFRPLEGNRDPGRARKARPV